MRRVEELKEFINSVKKKDMNQSNKDYINLIEDTLEFIDDMESTKIKNNDVRMKIKRLVYQLHDRLVINNES